MSVAVHDIRPALIVLTLCITLGAADPLTQSEPPVGWDSPFTAVPVLNAPFVAEAVMSVIASDGSPKETPRLADRYYRDSAGRVRVERSGPKGDLIIIDPDPGDNAVILLNSRGETYARVPMALAQFHFHTATNTTSPREVFNQVTIGGTRITYEVAPDLGLVVYARRNYPSLGTVEFQLINIQRLEPATELFQVPMSYLPAPAGTMFDLVPH